MEVTINIKHYVIHVIRKVDYMEKTEIELEKGLNEEVVKKISSLKREPEWMRDFRLKAYESFKKFPMPNFGPKLDIDFDSIHYYKRINEFFVNENCLSGLIVIYY